MGNQNFENRVEAALNLKLGKPCSSCQMELMMGDIIMDGIHDCEKETIVWFTHRPCKSSGIGRLIHEVQKFTWPKNAPIDCMGIGDEVNRGQE